MIGRIIEFSVKNKLLMLLLTGVLVLGGLYAVSTIGLDAIPDLSDVQVIIFTEFPGQAPQVVEDQVTYPLTTSMLSVPSAKVVRGYSFFGFSFVYIIFEDGTDIYWARSRVLEYLNFVADRLPPDVRPRLGPDATGVGWVYEYSLFSGWYCSDHQAGLYRQPGTSTRWYASPQEASEAIRKRLIRVRAFAEPGHCPVDGKALVKAQHDLAALRSIQDWYLRYELTAVDGVSEVAGLGGYVKQYQVEVDPNRLLAFNLSVADVRRAIQRSNNDVGGRVIEFSENEYMVRGLGYLGGGTSDPRTSQRVIDDLGHVSLGTTEDGAPIFLRDVASIHVGPEIRRGLAESNGDGEVAGGIVVMRFAENAYRVIANVKARLEELKAGLPPGVDVKPEYDRSALIERAVDTLKRKLLEEMGVVAVIIIFFLLHFRSSLVAIFVLPTGVLASIILMDAIGLNANIMSLGGIALAIGVMVDSAVIMIENAHKHLEQAPAGRSHAQIIIDASKEVGPQLFFSLLVITVSFLPIFSLGGQSGRLFRPLAFTKTFAIGAASILSITLIPVLMDFLVRGRIPHEGRNPVSKRAHEAVRAAVLAQPPRPAADHPDGRGSGRFHLLALLTVGQRVHAPARRGRSAFYADGRPLDFDHQGSRAEPADRQADPDLPRGASRLRQGGPGRHADRPGRPEHVGNHHHPQSRQVALAQPAHRALVHGIARLDEGTAVVFLARGADDHHRRADLRLERAGRHPCAGLDDVVKLPGMSNAWTMPIKTRIDMLSTGIKTPVGIKVAGSDLETLARLAEDISSQLRTLPETVSAFPEKTVGGYYVDFKIDRASAARYGMNVQDVQDVILSALGGMNVTTTVEGLERYPVNVRYPRELRDNLTALQQTLIATPQRRAHSGRAGGRSDRAHRPAGDPQRAGQAQRLDLRGRVHQRHRRLRAQGQATDRGRPSSTGPTFPRATASSGAGSTSTCRRRISGSRSSCRSRWS